MTEWKNQVNQLNFKFTSHEETEKEVNNLKIKKASRKKKA